MMGGIGSWLTLAIGPLVKRALVAVGIGTVSYVGASLALNQLLGAAKSALSGLSADVVQILALGGVFEAMSIIAGGMVAALSYQALKKFSLG